MSESDHDLRFPAVVTDVRNAFVKELNAHHFVTDKTGVRLVELAPADFLASEAHIFGRVNEDYVQREIQWYESQSLNVNDIPGGAPREWKRAADPDGFINS